MEEKLESAERKPVVVVVQKKKKGKKRKISRHIAEAAATKKQADEATTTTEGGGRTTKITANRTDRAPDKKKRKSSTAVVKDPAEAATYLISWQKHQKDSAATWKFNKCTQSWLIRHMYEADKVSKRNFALLLDYIKSGDKNTIQRCLEEATRRALRYQQKHQIPSQDQLDEESDSKNKKKEEDEKETSKNKAEDGSATRVNGEDEEVRWNNLDEHDKRKEYKRARKVLDTLS